MTLLVIDKHMDAVLLCKPLDKVVLVLKYSSRQVVCHPYVESTISLACHNIDIIVVHGLIWIPLFRGMTIILDVLEVRCSQ